MKYSLLAHVIGWCGKTIGTVLSAVVAEIVDCKLFVMLADVSGYIHIFYQTSAAKARVAPSKATVLNPPGSVRKLRWNRAIAIARNTAKA